MIESKAKLLWLVVLRVRVTRLAEALSRCAMSQKRECGAYDNGEPAGDAGRGERDYWLYRC